MAPECESFGSAEALKRAKSNVEKYFAVVGILEKWNESLEVLEHYVPAFFKGATGAYKRYMKSKPKNRNTIKPKIPQYIKEQMSANFTMEMEFYQFCRQRFHKQYLAVK